jgi:ABC-type multidrug transport system fused ATPase/permease subunit
LSYFYFYFAGYLDFDVGTAVIFLSLGPAIGALVNGQNYSRGRRISVRVGAAIISLLYKKSLSVDLNAVGQGVGAVNNLISVDMKEVQDFACFVQYLWSTVFEVSICLFLLFEILGVAALGGIFVILIALPLGSYGTKILDSCQSALLADKDNRISVVQEAIHGIKIVKWFAWENEFMERISAARRKEIDSLRSYMITDALLKINWGLVPTLVGLASFLIHTSVLGKTLTPAVGFTSILLFNFLRWPVTIFPDMINSMVCARLSLRRIEAYLDAADVTGLPQHSDKKDVNDMNNNDNYNEISRTKGKITLEMRMNHQNADKSSDAQSLKEQFSPLKSKANAFQFPPAPPCSVTIKNASFGWTIPSGDVAIDKVAEQKNKWSLRFRGSTTDANISVAGDSVKDDWSETESELDFGSDSDFRIESDMDHVDGMDVDMDDEKHRLNSKCHDSRWNRSVLCCAVLYCTVLH